MKKIIIIAFISLATVISFGATDKIINQAIAIVNNDVVTSYDLNQATGEMQAQLKASGLPVPKATALRSQVLRQLILQKIALQLAKTNNISVSDQEFNQALNSIAANNKLSLDQMKQKLKESGIDFKAYQTNIKQQLIITKLEQQAVSGSIMITPQQVDNFLKSRAKLKHPNTEYKVAHILIALPNTPTSANLQKTKAQAQNIVNKIRHGMSFSKAAITYSQSEDAKNGGVLGWRTANQLPTIFVNPISSMKPGQVVGPIKNNSGFHILKLVAEHSAGPVKHFIKQWRLREVMIKTSPVMSDAKARALLVQIKQDLKNGKSFSDLAKRYSNDNHSSTKGGDLGWQSQTEINPTIARQMQTLAKGGTSQPFKVNNDWYIIQVIATRQFNNTKTYVRNQARQTLFEQRAGQAVQTWQAKILGESYVKILDPKLKNIQ